MIYACMLSYFSHVQLFDSLQPYGLQTIRLLCPWNPPGKNTGVGSHDLLQGIFPTQGSNQCFLCFLHRQAGSLPLRNDISYKEKVKMGDTDSYCHGGQGGPMEEAGLKLSPPRDKLQMSEQDEGKTIKSKRVIWGETECPSGSRMEHRGVHM